VALLQPLVWRRADVHPAVLLLLCGRDLIALVAARVGEELVGLDPPVGVQREAQRVGLLGGPRRGGRVALARGHAPDRPQRAPRIGRDVELLGAHAAALVYRRRTRPRASAPVTFSSNIRKYASLRTGGFELSAMTQGTVL
jgi:hypothetical protein